MTSQACDNASHCGVCGFIDMSFRLGLAWLLALLSLAGHAQNLEKGKEINSTCAGCHGELGQGGSRGEYPRLAGQSARYLEAQLKAFRARTRVNIPMYPYTQERELPDALTRLTLTERVMIIPRVPGNLANGEAIYQKLCVTCHGKTGMGRGMFPMLVGQYTSYLKRQMEKYVKGDRPHDEEGIGGLLNKLREEDMQDILAYITTLQEQQ
jgi:cytochrome c553